MAHPSELFDYEAAKSFAQSVVRHEFDIGNEEASLAIADEEAIQHPWGWAFTPILIKRDIAESATAVDWQITIDRFNGKVTVVGRPDIDNRKPRVELILHSLGNNAAAAQLLHQLTGWTADQVTQKLEKSPIRLRSGPLLSLRSIHETFIERGATTTLSLIDA